MSYDPPFCYYEGGVLKFNVGGTNLGLCTARDVCLCGGGAQAPEAPPPPIPPMAPDNAPFRIRSGFGYCEFASAPEAGYPSDFDCITDGPDSYGNIERCTVEVMMDQTLVAVQYDVEDGYDYMTISGTQYTGTNGPAGVIPTTTIEWTSDHMVPAAGWKLCVSGGGAAAASPSSPSGSGAAAAAYGGFTVESGPCTVTAGGGCVRSDNYPGQYGTGVSCVIAPTQDLRLSSTAFATEKNYDMLTFNGKTFTGDLGPVLQPVTANQKIEWVSDVSVADTGCALCCAAHARFPSPHLPTGASLPSYPHQVGALRRRGAARR